MVKPNCVLNVPLILIKLDDNMILKPICSLNVPLNLANLDDDT